MPKAYSASSLKQQSAGIHIVNKFFLKKRYKIHLILITIATIYKTYYVSEQKNIIINVCSLFLQELNTRIED